MGEKDVAHPARRMPIMLGGMITIPLLSWFMIHTLYLSWKGRE
jgi:hypothetical protein